MAGFNVMEALSKNSRPVEEQGTAARFRTKDIAISRMYRNELNFYSLDQIEELAGDILLYGLKQNLELMYAPCEKGEYRIIAGERRWEALKLLTAQGHTEFEIATCKMTKPEDDDEEQVEIIIANAYRTKTVADMITEETRLKAALERMRDEGKKIKGYDLKTGRLRDVIADMLKMSKTKVAQIEAINNRLLPELRDELRNGTVTFSTAYELSGMEQEEQETALEKIRETGGLTHKDVREKKEKKKAVSESDTEGKGKEEEETEQAEETRAGDDYEIPHPEGITSICYSCTEYEACNVKTGTCTKCDRYQNRREAYKTDEERYEEEQDAIDRETRKKLREMEQEEKTQKLPSDTKKDEQKVHQIRIAKTYFDDVANGIKTFELRKNDRNYKTGDILELMEFADGRNTGRVVRMIVTYMLEGYAGLEEGYCILGIRKKQKEGKENE